MISAIANIAIHFKMGCTATLMGVAHAGLKIPPRVYSKGAYVPSRV